VLGVLHVGSREARHFTQCGGKLVAAYATMGETDLLVIVEFPGVGEAIRASVALNKALGIAFSTVPAIRVEEFDKLVAASHDFP
jgi:uncharacterized protein with GYD domain